MYSIREGIKKYFYILTTSVRLNDYHILPFTEGVGKVNLIQRKLCRFTSNKSKVDVLGCLDTRNQ